MMMVAAVVISAVGVFAGADFRPAAAETRAPFAFWILLLAIWGALNTVFLGGDLFTLYVALELVTFAAVPLVSLDGRAETLQAALRYLLPVRSFICSARYSSMVFMAPLTSCCCRTGFAQSLPRSSLRH
jgi:formate hydrogenlyase subunit 3/multisubunit Na+/H+ antiporter MnhD subunit